MQPDPNEIQKLTERVETLEKQVTEWKIEYEKTTLVAKSFAAFSLLLLLVQFLTR